ncbi:hypothetical protein PsorP6_002180 [Peronosclerospora sorghi]|uniref:Uncharacterized protein n=1 Tax=Peronosclerospora sorghi TaxID=230839 RepID=A0ACC0WUH5_9STRA|nr:hypothetical protein PsorP6_002180 [Peronosclerospora sorghi]
MGWASSHVTSSMRFESSHGLPSRHLRVSVHSNKRSWYGSILQLFSLMASSEGMSNADFARIFRKEAREEAENIITDKNNKISSVTCNNRELNRIRDATSSRHRSDPTDFKLDANKAIGIECGENNGSNSGIVSDDRPRLGFRKNEELGMGLDYKTEAASGAATKAAKLKKTFSWEKHTTGFGAKMLSKMGFKGRLGKKEDGVSATIEVKKRPAQMGIGFGDFVEARNLKQNRRLQKELKGEILEVEMEETPGVVEDDTLWRKRKDIAGRKKYKRAADLKQEAQNIKKIKKDDVVLDMRGPDVRMLSDGTAAFDVDPHCVEVVRPKLGDELIYNVRTVVNLAQGRIVDLSQKIGTNTERVVTMKKEVRLIKAHLEVDDVRSPRMQALIEHIKALDALREQSISLRSVEPLLFSLSELRRNFPLEFDAHKLQRLVPSLCTSSLRSLLANSDLFDQKTSDTVVLQLHLIQAFLTQLPINRNANHTTGSTSPVICKNALTEGNDLYNLILEETLWPAIVQWVNVDWQAKSAPSTCVDLFLKVRPYLSSEFEDAFLHQLVLARLKKECHCWDPRVDTIPIHEWLLPWLPYIGSPMQSLYPEIRLTLGSALNQWHPSDLTVLSVLSPWRPLWGEHEYGKFTHRHIVRKLIRCLHREFIINPANQSLAGLSWVLAWKDHLPDRQFIALLEGEFFPKWLKVLRTWIAGSPNLTELEKWYRGWKLLFETRSLATNERLLVHFHGALVLLEVASEYVGVPRESRRPVPELNEHAATNYQDALASARDETKQEPPILETKSSQTLSRNVSMKDAIENFAIAHNLTFMPKCIHDGQQVYVFGKHRIIIEQGVAFLEKSKGVFKPVDLEYLL